jgi:hypothetical protein
MMTLAMALERNREMQRMLADLARQIASDDPLRETEVAVAERIVELVGPLTPFITGSLSTAHAVFVEDDMTRVALNPLATNPESALDPHQYGPTVHAMGGISRSGHERAFYDVVLAEHGEELLDLGEETYTVSLEVFRT